MAIGKWLNNSKIIHKAKDIEKPCHACGYCPYGQLVEEFPLREKETKYAIKHNRYSKLVKGKGWIKCNKKDKDASPDINWAIDKVKNPYSCEVFGHNCPVYYHAEPLAEESK